MDQNGLRIEVVRESAGVPLGNERTWPFPNLALSTKAMAAVANTHGSDAAISKDIFPSIRTQIASGKVTWVAKHPLDIYITWSPTERVLTWAPTARIMPAPSSPTSLALLSSTPRPISTSCIRCQQLGHLNTQGDKRRTRKFKPTALVSTRTSSSAKLSISFSIHPRV